MHEFKEIDILAEWGFYDEVEKLDEPVEVNKNYKEILIEMFNNIIDNNNEHKIDNGSSQIFYHKIQKDKELFNFILKETSFLDKYNIRLCQRIYSIVYNLYEIPTCQHEDCNNLVKFDSINKGYHPYCSFICGKTSINVREKFKQTCLKIYGYENPYQNEKVKEHIKQICLERYNCENYFQFKDFQEIRKQTCLKKYNCEHSSQNIDIFNKTQKSGYTKKSYILPSRKKVFIQGYEYKFLNEYFQQGGLEPNILIKTKDINNKIGAIWYEGEDSKQHKYFPDFYLINENKIIEVKSTYTYNKFLEKNLLKQQACLDKGLNFEFKIYER